jgi:hypothetical protein
MFLFDACRSPKKGESFMLLEKGEGMKELAEIAVGENGK